MMKNNGAAGQATRRLGPPEPLGRHETIDSLLKTFKRDGVPIRKTFVQQGRGGNTKPGPLAEFLTNRDERALDAYLLIHALASIEPWNCDYPSGFWVRSLGLADGRDIQSKRSAISKIFKRLEDRNLIERARSKRLASVTLLSEDGLGNRYEHPYQTGEQWFQLPHAYWLDRYYEKLSLRAKVMLLIALERPDGFYLPQEKARAWYGVSADSADRGLRELRNKGILVAEQDWIKAPRSDTGWTEQWTYTLQTPFSTEERNRASEEYQRSLATAGVVEDAS